MAVLDLLGTLIDKSLVIAEGEEVPRYRMLETTRAFALEQLAAPARRMLFCARTRSDRCAAGTNGRPPLSFDRTLDASLRGKIETLRAGARTGGEPRRDAPR